MRFFLTELDAVVRNLNPEEAERVVASSLPSAMLFWACGSAKTPKNIKLVEKAFQGNIGMALAMHRTKESSKHARGNGEANEPRTDMDRLADLLNALGLAEEAYRWPKSESFLTMARGGAIDHEGLASDFQLKTEESAKSIDLLSALNHHSKWPDETVQEAIKEARKSLRTPGPISLGYIFSLFRVIYYLAQNWVTDFTPDEWTKEVIDVLRDLSKHPEKLESADFEAWPDNYDENAKKVIAASEEASEAAQALYVEQERRALLHGLLTGENYFPDQQLRPVFAGDVDATMVLNEIKRTGISSVQRIQGFMRSRLRYTNAADIVGTEKDFANRIADLIDESVTLRRPMPVFESELLVLGRLMRTFAEEMQKQLNGAQG